MDIYLFITTTKSSTTAHSPLVHCSLRRLTSAQQSEVKELFASSSMMPVSLSSSEASLSKLNSGFAPLFISPLFIHGFDNTLSYIFHLVLQRSSFHTSRQMNSLARQKKKKKKKRKKKRNRNNMKETMMMRRREKKEEGDEASSSHPMKHQ